MSASDGKTENERLAIVEQQIKEVYNAINQLGTDVREFAKSKVSKEDLRLELELRDQKIAEQNREFAGMKALMEKHIEEQKQNKRSFVNQLPTWISTSIAVLASLWAIYEWASHLHG